MLSRLKTLLPGMTGRDHRPGGKPDSRLRRNRDSLIMLALAAALVAGAFSYGLSKGMHLLFSGPLDTRAQQIASAMSDTAYGLNLKYAFHAKIRDTLRAGGMSDLAEYLQPLGLKHPDHFLNTKLWNDLLPKAARLEGVTKPVTVANKALDFIYAEDPGMVDYYKMSFRLFGYNIQGFFYTYFLLLGLSIALVFVAFWSRPGILIGVNFLLLGLVFSIFRIDDTDSVANGRFLSTLAVLPVFHLAVLIWSPPRIASVAAGAAFFQAAFLAVVLSMRSSSMWGVLLLGALAAALALIGLRNAWNTQSLKAWLQKAASWPVLVVLIATGGTTVYLKSTIHPAYSTLDELMPSHFFWHSLAAGLSFVDGIDEMVPGLNGARFDALGTYLGNAYLKKTMGFEPASPSAYYSSHHFPSLGRLRSYERVVQAAYLDFARQHPATMIRLTFVAKPMELLRLFSIAVAGTLKRNWMPLTLVCAVFVAGILAVRPAQRYRAEIGLGLKVVAAMTAACSLPAIVAYPSHMGDALAVYIAAIAMLLLAAAISRDMKFVRSILSQ